MTIFKDRLPGTIRIKKKFAPSPVRINEFQNKTFAVVSILLGLTLLILLFDWLAR